MRPNKAKTAFHGSIFRKPGHFCHTHTHTHTHTYNLHPPPHTQHSRALVVCYYYLGFISMFLCTRSMLIYWCTGQLMQLQFSVCFWIMCVESVFLSLTPFLRCATHRNTRARARTLTPIRPESARCAWLLLLPFSSMCIVLTLIELDPVQLCEHMRLLLEFQAECQLWKHKCQPNTPENSVCESKTYNQSQQVLVQMTMKKIFLWK